jgi:hypothetical protein
MATKKSRVNRPVVFMNRNITANAEENMGSNNRNGNHNGINNQFGITIQHPDASELIDIEEKIMRLLRTEDIL